MVSANPTADPACFEFSICGGAVPDAATTDSHEWHRNIFQGFLRSTPRCQHMQRKQGRKAALTYPQVSRPSAFYGEMQIEDSPQHGF